MIIPRLHIEAALFLLRIIASKASRQTQPQKLKKQPPPPPFFLTKVPF